MNRLDDPPLTLDELLRRSAARFAGSEIVFPGERCTVAELDRRADGFARLLVEAGVAPGEHVGLWLPAGLTSIAALFGVFRAGAVAVPLSDRLRRQEIAYVVEHADIAVLLVEPTRPPHDRIGDLRAVFPELDRAETASWTLAAAPTLRRILTVGGEPGHPAFETLYEPTDPARADPVPAEERGELAYLMYTSGTSADPKACMITHAGCILQGDSLAFHRYLLDEESAFWCPLPLFHTAGLATLTACLSSGARYVHAGVFEPGQALRMLEAESVTHAIPAFETIWLRVLDHPDFAATDLRRLRVVLMTGGEELLRKLQARLPEVAQITNFGMTESTGHLAMNRPDDPLQVRVTTGGFPLPGMEVRIVDADTGAVLGPDRRGEIQFRGPSRCLGYYRDPEITAASFAEGGWFRSGDLGVLDEAGRLSFRGRLKDMLKVGGENVAALEVESYLLRHPAVNIVAVVGVPDAYYGEVPAAFVQRAPGAEVSAEELIAFCLDEIATFKVPRYVRFVDEWPMSGTKIRKFVLRDSLAAELAAAGVTEAPRLSSGRARRLAGLAPSTIEQNEDVPS